MIPAASDSTPHTLERSITRSLILLVDSQGVVLQSSGTWAESVSETPPTPGSRLSDFLVGPLEPLCADIARACEKTLAHGSAGTRTESNLGSPPDAWWIECTVTPFKTQETDAVLVSLIDNTERKKTEQELQEQATRLQAILDHDPDCVKLIGLDGRLLEMNPAGLRIIEAESLAQVIGRHVADLVHPEDRNLFLLAHQSACEGRPGRLCFRFNGLKGGQSWVESHCMPLRDAKGTVTSILSLTQDITERRVAEELLRRSEARMASAQRISRFGNWELDLANLDTPGSNPLFWSDEVYRIFGHVPGSFEASKEHFFSAVHPEDREMVRIASNEAIRTRGRYSIDHRIVLPSGEIRHIHEDAQMFLDEVTGKALKMIGTAHDITERKQAEEALKTSEERFRRAFANAGVGFAITDISGTVLHINERYCEITGHTESELVGRSFTAITHPDDVEKKRQMNLRLLGGEIPDFIVEKRYLRKDGGIAWVENSVSLIRDETGSPQNIVVLCKDITASRRDQEHLRLLETCVAHLNDTVLVTEAAPLEEPGPRILFVNEAFTKETGYTRADALGRSPRFLQGPETDRETLNRIREALVAGRSVKEEVVNYRKDGSPFSVEIDMVPVAGPNGKPTHFASIQRNITERKATAERLRDTNLRYQRQHDALTSLMRSGVLNAEDLENAFQLIAECAARATMVERVSIWLFDRDRQAIVCQELFEASASRHTSGQELRAADFPGYFHALRENELIAADDAHLDPRTSEFADSYLRPQGIVSMLDAPLNVGGVLVGVLCQEHSGTPRQWTQDEQSFAVSLANFVSLVIAQVERKHFEEQLRQQASLLEKARDAINVRTLDNTVTFWNRSSENLYGWKAEEAIGQDVSKLLYHDVAEFAVAMGQVMAHGEWTGEIHQITKSGSEVIVEGRWTLVKDSAGQPKAVLAINTDVTEKKKLEAHVLRTQRMESIGTLAGGIAHDLNNVLTPILMSIDLLRMRFKDKLSQDTLATIATSARRGAEMIQQVLSFARGADGSRLPVRFRGIFEDITRLVRDTFPKNIRLNLQTSPSLWTVSGDTTQIHQVLLNLCVNARDAMPNGGTLTIGAENATIDAQYAATNIEARQGPCVIISVADNGIGIPREIVDKIFDPFFTTKETGRGTGLGLATTLAIVKGHGGFIRTTSEVGHGTRFSVHLPAEPTALNEQPLEEDPTLPRGSNQLILVVDDEACVREITRQTLQACGYRVLLAADGAEAVALYSTQQPEIAAVLTDMMMPVMDGHATIQVLRKMNSAVRIIAASGIQTNGSTARVAPEGVALFLPKPYTAGTILRALNQVLAPESA